MNFAHVPNFTAVSIGWREDDTAKTGVNPLRTLL
jgi:hypothetical protein